MRIGAVLIGLGLLLFVYYCIRYDFLPKDFYSSRAVGGAAAFGLLFTIGPLWHWFNEWRRSRRK